MRKNLTLSAAILTLLIASIVLTAFFLSLRREYTPHVGISYCGNSVSEAKLLIDKVKEYTNLFVLQSGDLQRDQNAVFEIGDYAVSSGLNFLPFFSQLNQSWLEEWASQAKKRWGNHFLGVYYGDELAGRTIDSQTNLYDYAADASITKTTRGQVIVEESDGTRISYEKNGDIYLFKPVITANTALNGWQNNETLSAIYYQDGTMTAKWYNGTEISNQSFSNYELPTREDVMNDFPFKDQNKIANLFVTYYQKSLERLKNQSIRVFTSDYTLYWFDFLAGYDVTLAQFGWNISIEKEIAQVRGAAQIQGKSWGAVITYKYDVTPFLASGKEIYDQMRTAYESGADYIYIFNYPAMPGHPEGILADEHFDALKQFWHDYILTKKDRGITSKAEAVLILPNNLGWGMRFPEDKIWGWWEPNNHRGSWL